MKQGASRLSRRSLAEPVRVKPAPVDSVPVTWRCFACGHTILQPTLHVSRDGGHWCAPPSEWLFVADGNELTFVCSVACLTKIYENDT